MTESVEGPLSTYISSDNIRNVVIFVCDSTRTDALPRDVSDRGVVGRMIAPSTFTASSLPSLLCGQYPSEHRVWDFEGQLRKEPVLLRNADHSGFRADTIWTHLEPENKPPLRMTRTTEGGELESLEPPFVYVEHDKGGHSPYGCTFEECESTDEFYRDVIDGPGEIPAYYERGVKRAAERFTARLDTLEDRGLLEETLVIFTSDHGELLGESEYGTVYEHKTPMTPELVNVPTVFAGAGLPTDLEFESLLSGLDIVPTALSAQGRSVPKSLPGADLWSQSPPGTRYLRSEIWAEYDLRGDRTIYGASSVWTNGGGYVFHRGSAAARAVHALYYHNHSAPHARVRPLTPGAQLRLLRTYVPETVTYGTPEVDESTARDHLPGPFTRGDTGDSEVDEYTREQLRRLGYT